MRRTEVTSIDLSTIDVEHSTLTITEKGGRQRKCKISREGLKAIKDYIREERGGDSELFPQSPALFLPRRPWSTAAAASRLRSSTDSGTKSPPPPGSRDVPRIRPAMPWASTSSRRPATPAPPSSNWGTKTPPPPCSTCSSPTRRCSRLWMTDSDRGVEGVARNWRRVQSTNLEEQFFFSGKTGNMKAEIFLCP